ncbi:MAG: MOSC domain-containing protein [Bacteroidota bacterium]|nr:MOSC domain-containing protein [Bacteroidota bacterium]
MSFTVSALYIYPVKSLGGFSVAEAAVTAKGFEHDRRWMLIDKAGKFFTQREVHAMALLQTAITPDGVYIYHKQNPEKNISVPFLSTPVAIKKVQVWDDECEAWVYDDVINDWFSEILKIACELVYMPDETNRLVDTGYAKDNETTSFSDGYPFLIIGQSSLDELNAKLPVPLKMDRFRPNIVFTSGEPHAEDGWKHFTINEIEFFGVKTCGRCVITTIDQQTTAPGKEPLKMLSTYRSFDNKIKFGMNLLYKGSGCVKVGDKIIVHTQ